jgi:hypothetical protein
LISFAGSLYDPRQDPEELHNLGSEQKTLARDMLENLKAKLDDVNQTFAQRA